MPPKRTANVVEEPPLSQGTDQTPDPSQSEPKPKRKPSAKTAAANRSSKSRSKQREVTPEKAPEADGALSSRQASKAASPVPKGVALPNFTQPEDLEPFVIQFAGSDTPLNFSNIKPMVWRLSQEVKLQGKETYVSLNILGGTLPN